MYDDSEDCLANVKTLDFGCIPVDTLQEKIVVFTNDENKPIQYQMSVTYIVNNIDRVFNIFVPTSIVNPGEECEVKVSFKPNVAGQSFTDYYSIDDSAGNSHRLTVTGRCFGPEVSLNKNLVKFHILKNVDESNRKAVINMINTAGMDTIYQWMLPNGGQSYFQISTGHCGVIRAFESITSTIVFSGVALGIYTAELVCLVLNQEPLFLNVLASVTLPGNPLMDSRMHTFDKTWLNSSPSAHLMENSLTCLDHLPPASVLGTHLDFGVGCAKDICKNISLTLCVTNHLDEEGYVQWITDPDNIFIIDPVECTIPPKLSKMFTVRFRPTKGNEVYGYILCGDYQYKFHRNDGTLRLKHTVFRIPCVGTTWNPCTQWAAEWDCPLKVVMPPTVPKRTTFSNFTLSNKLDVPIHFIFEGLPSSTNDETSRSFVVMPMCGTVPSRGWQIITVALEPKALGDYIETWDLVINRDETVTITFSGSAQASNVEIMSHGYNPYTHAMFEFPPTITGATNYCTAYFHNFTRMEIHMRVLSNVDWLGADNSGSIIIPPCQILKYHWWFFPKTPNLVYDTTVTCSCVCLIDGKPVGEPTELLVHIFGFSEYPELKVLPKRNNLHDVAVGKTASCTVTLYNNCSCFFTSKLYWALDGMDDDWSGDRFHISNTVNSLKPNQFCSVTLSLIPDGAGPRQVSIQYTVLFRNEYDQVQEIQPVKSTICKIWYDGVYPSIQIKRTISVSCPIILSNHCLWNMTNVDELNRALVECRPHEPLRVSLYGPDLCVTCGMTVELVFIMNSVYQVPVPWSLRREKICECDVVEEALGISLFTKKHACIHRPLVDLQPRAGRVTKQHVNFLRITLKYELEGLNTLCFVLSLPNQRQIHIFVNVFAHLNTKGVLVPLRRPIEDLDEKESYLAELDCGRVPINNLDPVIRIIWLYNPTDVFTTWRLIRGQPSQSNSAIRCLLYFAEVAPLGKLAIPFSFLPTEMIYYNVVFSCSFGYDIHKIQVVGQGGLPNCIETRLDIPYYKDKIIRSSYRDNIVYLSTDHITLPIMATHSLSREIVCICNDTDHIMRFIWLPERLANIVNVVMTPCWGTISPKSSEWITMTIYTLQEPATFTIAVACELLDLTERRRYQKNESLRRMKIEKCNQEFIITENGFFHPNINDSPPYVLDLKKPQPTYVSLSVSVSSKGQRDGFTRLLISQMWAQVPPYDLLSSDMADRSDKAAGDNNMTTVDIIRLIDGILWDVVNGKMFKDFVQFYAGEDIPTYAQLVKRLQSKMRDRLSRRVTSGICDAIVNKAVFNAYALAPKQHEPVLESEE